MSWRTPIMIKALIRIRIGSMFSGGAGKDGKPKKRSVAGVIAIFALLALTFAVFFLSIAAPLALVLVPMGLAAQYFAIFNIITFGIVFVLSVFETKSELFECRDNELLLSMPIRPRDIVLSRAISVIILNLAEAMIISLPAVAMFVVAGGGAWYIPSAIISSALIAMLATALSSAVGYFVALIASRIKHNTIITVVLTLGFLALYFVGYNAFLGAIEMLEENPDKAGDAIASALAPMSFFGNISLFKPLETTIFVVISVGAALLAWAVISKHYIKIITRRATLGKKAYVRRELSGSSVLVALSKKELLGFFSNSAYILNGIMGALFQIVLAVMLLISRDSIEPISVALGAFGGEGILELLCTVVLIGCASMSAVSASALSLEGKNFWIIKSSPIPTDALIYAKLVPHLAVSVPTSIVSSVIAAIAIGASPIWWVFMLLLPIVANLVFAMLGLILNIAMPKFEFANVAQVVKQSMPVFIITLGGMLFLLLIGGAAIGLSLLLGPALAAIILSALFIALLLIMYLILTGPSKRRLERL